MSFVQNEILLSLKKSCLNYGRNLVDIVTRAILLVICTTILNIIVLYFYNILWHIYRLTYIGSQFVIQQPQRTQMITAILSNDINGLSLNTTLAAFVICMVISATCRTFYLSRFFYQSQGKIGKLVLWGLPLTALVSMYTNSQHGFHSWAAVIPITIVPTLCVFTYCFTFSDRLLPELGDVIKAIFIYFKKIASLTISQTR
jgi:hypothetical protein